MLAFGAYFVPMHAASTQDWLWPAFLFRCTSVTLVWSVVLVRRVRPTGLRPHLAALIAIGFLDTGGNALFAAASSAHGLLSVVSVLASLYPVVTVMLARLVLGERRRLDTRCSIRARSSRAFIRRAYAAAAAAPAAVERHLPAGVRPAGAFRR